MEKKFNTLEILEHFGSSWKLKVSRDNYSIGYLFGMMEGIQTQFSISEYSVISTTLEQIFNNFALQGALKPDARQHTLRRRSTAGNRADFEKMKMSGIQQEPSADHTLDGITNQ